MAINTIFWYYWVNLKNALLCLISKWNIIQKKISEAKPLELCEGTVDKRIRCFLNKFKHCWHRTTKNRQSLQVWVLICQEWYLNVTHKKTDKNILNFKRSLFVIFRNLTGKYIMIMNKNVPGFYFVLFDRWESNPRRSDRATERRMNRGTEELFGEWDQTDRWTFHWKNFMSEPSHTLLLSWVAAVCWSSS